MSSVLTHPGVKAPAEYIEQVMSSVKAKNPAEPEFHQAVAEVFDSLQVSAGETSRVSILASVGKDCRARTRHHVPRSLV